MTGEIESKPEESRERGETREGRESSEQQRLDDATLDPGALIEQSGEFRQAEDVQEGLTSLVENAGDLTVIPTPWVDGAFMPPPVIDYSVETQPEDGTVKGSQPPIRGDLDQVTVKGTDSPGGFEATPIPLPGVRGTASEESGTEGRGADTSSEVQQVQVEKDNNPPPPPPDMERLETVTESGSESEGRGSIPASRLDDAELSPTAGTLEAEAVNLEQPVATLEGVTSDTGVAAGLATDEVPVEESGEGGSEGESTGEAEEGWTPPEMYAHADSSGAITIVDADGKPIDCPPTITKVVGNDGKEKYLATYQSNGKTYSFEVTSYISSLSDLYVGYDQDGKLTVFNGKGEKVDSPPVITKFVDEKGMEQYTAYYPGAGPGSGVVLGAYTGSLQDCYSHIGQDGKVTIVDADGNPLKCQPATYKFVDDKGMEQVVAYYPGAGESGKVTITSYTTSLQDCYVNYGQGGKVTIVDADGNPLKCQPVTYKFVDGKGVEQVVAYYPGAGESGKVALSSYTAPLQNCYTHYGQDGKVTIVGADGKPLASQPLTYKIVDSKGVEQVIAYYPGAGESGKVTLSSYSTSLQNCYSYIGQGGKVTVVGADGKPLTSQPLTYKIVDAKGVEHSIAYYPGDQTKTTLTGYLPPSSYSKPEPIRHAR